jgi:phospholipid/cholesterol/gamma-HCH transport system permease protein
MINSLGRFFLVRVLLLTDIVSMLLLAFRNAIRACTQGTLAIRRVALRQLFFTGFDAAYIIIVIAVIISTVIIAQIQSLVGDNGSLTGKILVWVVLRELAPLLTAIIVIARSGTAIAAELGAMKINGEIESIEMLGISADSYLVMPRIIGVTASIVILTVYFVLSVFVGSFMVASIGWHISYDQLFQGIMASLGIKEIVMLFSKSVFFGLFISSTCCWYGLGVGRNATEIPQAATRAVMTSLFTVFVLDGLITYLVSHTIS